MSKYSNGCAPRTCCAACGNEAPSKRCQCGAEPYCSAGCQSSHWPEHKKRCTVALRRKFERRELDFDGLLHLGNLLHARKESSRAIPVLLSALECAGDNDIPKCPRVVDMLMADMYCCGRYEELIHIVKESIPRERSTFGGQSDRIGRLLGAWGACEARLGRDHRQNKDYQEALQSYKGKDPSLILGGTEEDLYLAMENRDLESMEILMRRPGFEALPRMERNHWSRQLAQRYLWSCSLRDSDALGDAEAKRRVQRSLEILHAVRSDFRQALIQKGALLAETIYLIGYAYWQTGNTGRAVKKFEKALKLFSEEGNAAMVQQTQAMIAGAMTNAMPEFTPFP